MANLPKTEPFGKFIIEVEWPKGSGQFRAPMAFIKKSLKRTTATSDTIVVDADDPDLPADTLRNKVSRSWELTGDGACAVADIDMWETVDDDPDSWLFRVTRREIGADGGRVYLGYGILNDLSDTSDKKSEGGRTQRSVSIQGDGPLAKQNLP
jgi:hypothetical protein